MTNASNSGATVLRVTSLLVEMEAADALGRADRASRPLNPTRRERPMIASPSLDSSILLRCESVTPVLLEESLDAIKDFVEHLKGHKVHQTNVAFAQLR